MAYLALICALIWHGNIFFGSILSTIISVIILSTIIDLSNFISKKECSKCIKNKICFDKYYFNDTDTLEYIKTLTLEDRKLFYDLSLFSYSHSFKIIPIFHPLMEYDEFMRKRKE